MKIWAAWNYFKQSRKKYFVLNFTWITYELIYRKYQILNIIITLANSSIDLVVQFFAKISYKTKNNYTYSIKQ